MTKIRLLAVLFLLSVCTISKAQQFTLLNRTTVGTDPLGDTGEKFGSLNGKSHQNDAVVTHNGWQYTAYYNDRSPRKIVLARRKLTSTTWEKFVYSRYSQTTNDGHNVISIGKSPHDGTLHLSFDHHGSALNYFKSKPGLLNNPGSKSWDNTQFNNVTDDLGFGQLRGITYPIFVTAPNGNMYFSRRLGNSIVGDQLLYEYKNSTWTNVGKYIEGNDNNAYLDNLYIDNNGRMHAAWIWRSTGGVSTARDICYAYSNDYGRNWFDSSGKKVGTLNNGAMSYNGDPSLTAVPVAAGQMTNQEGMTVDLKGRPHVVHRVGTTIRHFYQDSNGNWQNIDTELSPRGRASIIADKNHNVYIVFGNFRVARATEAGNYRDWTVVYSNFDGDFTGDPLVDRYRMIEDDILSVYMMSENYNSCDVIDFDLGLSDSGPNGYTFSANENQTVNVSGTKDIAFGANGQFRYLMNQTQDVGCTRTAFGGDPAPGVAKKCYIRNSSSSPDYTPPGSYVLDVNEGATVNVSGTMNVAYGANGQFVFLYNQTGNVSCNNDTFGSDPAPGVPKKCFVRSK
ncbi:MAG: BNR repeat-containing protein, partial [Leeuwenhoekiella sp.]